MGTVTGWRKASYSSGNGGNCVEVGQDWRKASYSGNGGNDCVEVGQVTVAVAVRDTRDRAGVTLSVPASAWAAFTASLR
jgi:hypothetical protein